MVNADGDFVIAKPDKAAWELYQEKAKASAAAAAEAAAAEESKALQARGLECPIDKRMFLEPTKTPCCQRTYCNDCISNALIESDFVCPGCSTEGVLLDNLTPDEEAASKIKTYEAEKAEAKKEKEKQSAGQDGVPSNRDPDNDEPKEVNSKERSPSHPETVDADASTQSKKRPAEDDSTPEVGGDSPGNAAKKHKGEDEPEPPSTESTAKDASTGPAMSFNSQMPFGGFGMMPPFSESGFSNDAMGFINPMAMPNGFPNTMGPGWNPMNMPFNPLQSGMYGDQSHGFPNMFNGDPSMSMFPMAQMAAQIQNPGFQNPGMNNFSNQQRTAFGGPYSREEDSPYFRQPVNPQRHQARNRRVRPSDYREL
jgi:protein MPE1